jgi:hypothetical protein
MHFFSYKIKFGGVNFPHTITVKRNSKNNYVYTFVDDSVNSVFACFGGYEKSMNCVC